MKNRKHFATVTLPWIFLFMSMNAWGEGLYAPNGQTGSHRADAIHGNGPEYRGRYEGGYRNLDRQRYDERERSDRRERSRGPNYFGTETDSGLYSNSRGSSDTGARLGARRRGGFETHPRRDRRHSSRYRDQTRHRSVAPRPGEYGGGYSNHADGYPEPHVRSYHGVGPRKGGAGPNSRRSTRSLRNQPQRDGFRDRSQRRRRR